MRKVLFIIITILSFEAFAQKANSKLTLRELGDQYLNEQRKASDDSLTFLIFDSLSSPLLTTRQYCFKVATFIEKKSDGALSEAINVYSLKYITKHTLEFSKNIATVTPAEWDSWAYYIGVELVLGAEPKGGQTEMQYAKDELEKIKSSCSNCPDKDKKTLKDFLAKALEVVEHNLK